MWQCDIQIIYIKNICRSNEKLIVEKQIRNEQHFYKFERCSVDTLSTNFRFFVSISVVTYNFYSWITLLRFFEHIFCNTFFLIRFLSWSNVIFAILLFRVLDRDHFAATNKIFNVALYCNHSNAVVT